MPAMQHRKRMAFRCVFDAFCPVCVQAKNTDRKINKANDQGQQTTPDISSLTSNGEGELRKMTTTNGLVVVSSNSSSTR